MHPNLFIILYLLKCVVLVTSQSKKGEFTLTILHLNDFHARFEETSVNSGRCSAENAANNKCYGGFPRIRSKVEELRASKPNSLFMAGGDYFQGTVWYTVHKWRAMAHFLNLIEQDVMSLGNHEFDDGVDGLVPFLDNVTFPCLAANIDASMEPTMKGKVLPSFTFERGGRKIGVVGYITTETVMIANTSKVLFHDEVNAVREEAKRLKGQGVDIIIALGHAGINKDKDIAKNVEDVDIVVGGHTNTFLYSGDVPSTDIAKYDYPLVVTQDSGRTVLVVQAYAFGKYLGLLDATFDNNGEIIRWEGNPILLDNTVTQDPTILRELVVWKEEVQKIVGDTIGRTFVFLNGSRFECRARECNLGNLIVDAIIHQNAKYPDDLHWAKTSLAVTNSGGIRSSIDETVENGSVTMEDVLTVAPFRNTIDIVELKGKHVKQMFEHSVSLYDPEGMDLKGQFLQVSGFQVTYDLSKNSGSRVASLRARCVKCRVPEMKDVEDDVTYSIAMPAFIANGGDSFTVIKEKKIRHHLTGLLDSDIISQYIRLYSPIYQGIENRILFLQESSQSCSALPSPPLSSKTTLVSSSTSSVTPFSSSISLPSSLRLDSIPIYTKTSLFSTEGPYSPSTSQTNIPVISPPIAPTDAPSTSPSFNVKPNQYRIKYSKESKESNEFSDLLDLVNDYNYLDNILDVVEKTDSDNSREVIWNPLSTKSHDPINLVMTNRKQQSQKVLEPTIIKQTPNLKITRKIIKKLSYGRPLQMRTQNNMRPTLQKPAIKHTRNNLRELMPKPFRVIVDDSAESFLSKKAVQILPPTSSKTRKLVRPKTFRRIQKTLDFSIESPEDSSHSAARDIIRPKTFGRILKVSDFSIKNRKVSSSSATRGILSPKIFKRIQKKNDFSIESREDSRPSATRNILRPKTYGKIWKVSDFSIKSQEDSSSSAIIDIVRPKTFRKFKKVSDFSIESREVSGSPATRNIPRPRTFGRIRKVSDFSIKSQEDSSSSAIIDILRPKTFRKFKKVSDFSIESREDSRPSATRNILRPKTFGKIRKVSDFSIKSQEDSSSSAIIDIDRPKTFRKFKKVSDFSIESREFSWSPATRNILRPKIFGRSRKISDFSINQKLFDSIESREVSRFSANRNILHPKTFGRIRKISDFSFKNRKDSSSSDTSDILRPKTFQKIQELSDFSIDSQEVSSSSANSDIIRPKTFRKIQKVSDFSIESREVSGSSATRNVLRPKIFRRTWKISDFSNIREESSSSNTRGILRSKPISTIRTNIENSLESSEETVVRFPNDFYNYGGESLDYVIPQFEFGQRIIE